MPAHPRPRPGGTCTRTLDARRATRSGVLLCGIAVLLHAAPTTAPAQQLAPSGPDSAPAQVEPTLLAAPIVAEPDLPISGGAGAAEAAAPAVEVPTANGTEISPTPRRFRFHLALDGAFSYDDNITLTPTDKVQGSFLRLGAVITLGFGDLDEHEGNYLRLDYSPSAFLYLNDSQYNTIDHLVHLEAYHRFARLAATFSEDIESTENTTVQAISTAGGFTPGANIDVSKRQRLNSYASHLTATYDLGARTILSLAATYLTTDYQSLINSTTISGTVGVDYRYGPKLTVGLAGTVGENLVDPPSPDQTFEQLNVRASYQATGKIAASGSVGVEYRQYDTGSSIDPVFQLGVDYTPFEGTTVRFATSRQTYNSATLLDQDYSATAFAVGISQSVFRRFTVVVTAGYENLTYFSTLNGDSGDRQDNYYFIEPAVNVKITRFWEAGLYYRHRENNSSVELFGFDENQVGIHSGIKF